MNIEISKRKLESYKRAEKVAQELRYQMQSVSFKDEEALFDFVIHWMRTTGDIKFERPQRPKVR